MLRRPPSTRLPFVLLIVVFLGCGDSGSPGHSPEAMQGEGSRPVEKGSSGVPAPGAATPDTVQEGASRAESPARPSSASLHDPEKGAVLYAQYCAACHGAHGDGKGPASQALEPKPANHQDGRYMNALSNEHLFKVIKQGGASVGKSPLMAPWGGTLSDEQIWDLVAFVRTLAKPPYTGPKP